MSIREDLAAPEVHVTFDHSRADRIGVEEAVLAQFKEVEHISAIIAGAQAGGRRLLITRLAPEKQAALPQHQRQALDYCTLSQTAFLGSPQPRETAPRVAVVTAGTSDARPALEAVRVLAYSGLSATLIGDVGVAGLWRLLRQEARLREMDVVIVCAGMDAALPSVVAGLVPGVVIAVPTSVGYGVAHGGRVALDSALASCAPGVLVVNIDNGYGAACAALRLANRMARHDSLKPDAPL